MQGLLRCRGYDLADEQRCLLITLADCAPEGLPPGAAPPPPEWAKRKLVNFLPGSCVKLRRARGAALRRPSCSGACIGPQHCAVLGLPLVPRSRHASSALPPPSDTPARRPLPAAPDGSPRTEGSLLLHLDPHIPFLPAFLLNFVLGVLAP